jgi:hypothetical protein
LAEEVAMTDTFAYLARVAALRERFGQLRTELAATTGAEDRALIYEEAVAVLHRIRELETRHA